MAGGGLEELAASLLHFGRLISRFFQVPQVRRAIAATDRPKMKIDIILFFLVQGFQQETPQLPPRGTTEAMSPPNVADGVKSVIPSPQEHCRPLSQRFRTPQRRFHNRHPLDGQGFLEIPEKIFIGQVSGGHGFT